jgi:phosphoenolpyruvate---glycerone phosphotransferase subunit DhaK
VPELFLLDPAEGAATSLQGFARLHPDIRVSTDPSYIRHTRPAPARRVALVSGGGAGHEPLHSGFVGTGMLDAAVPGKIFASPHNRQVYEASKAVALPGGVLHIVKNYTGDKINFGIAAERLSADGVQVGRVLVDDDVATDSDATATGRRGTAATLVVEKILGAAADRGDDLSELVSLGRAVADHSRSIAVASEALVSPHTGERAFRLAADELEYGVGIHGERAAATITRPPLDSLVARMLDDVLGSLPAGSAEVLLVVNGLGATSDLELYAIYDIAATRLAQLGLHLVGGIAGTLVAALNMSGFSITVTRMADPEWRPLWAAPATAPAWKVDPR